MELDDGFSYSDKPALDDGFNYSAEPSKPQSAWDRIMEFKRRKDKEFLEKSSRPIGTQLLEALGNIPLPTGDMGALSAINMFTGEGKRARANLGLLSPNAATPASMVKGGVIDPALGITQIASRLSGVGASGVQSAVDAVHNYYNEHFDESPAGEAAGGVLVAGPGGVAKHMVRESVTPLQKLLRIARSTGKGSAVAVGSTSEANVKDDKDYWERKKLEAILGGALGGGSGIAAQIAKGNPGARLLGKEGEREAALSRAEEIRDFTKSEQFPNGAEPSLGEILQSPNIQRVENWSEYLPFSGKKGQLENQNIAIAARLKEIAEARRGDLGPAGAGATISESAKRVLANNKKTYGQPFNDIRSIVDDSGVRVTPKDAISSVYAAIHELEQVTGNEESIKKLRALAESLESGQYGDTFGKLQAEQDTIQKRAAEQINSGNPDSILAAKQAGIGKGFGSDIQRTLAMVDPSGELSAKWSRANSDYSSRVRAYNPNQPAGWEGHRPEARILHGKDLFSDTVADRILSGDNRQMAEYVKGGTDEAGHRAVNAAITQSIEAASKGEAGLVSPKKASNAIEKHKNFISEFFPESDKREILGFGKAMVALERSGQFLEKLQTGKFVGAMGSTAGTGAGLLAAPGATLSLLTSVRLYNKLSGSKAGKEWLLNAAKYAPDSPQMKELVKRLPVVLGIGAGDIVDE